MGCGQKTLMMLFLTCFGTVVLLLSDLILAFGEVCALCAYITFSQYNVMVTRQFFNEISAFVLLGIDKQSFKNCLKLESNSKLFFQSFPILVIYLLILNG